MTKATKKKNPKGFCPVHGLKMVQSKTFKAPDGYDEKMTRWACLMCGSKYWYHAPKFSRHMDAEEVQVAFNIFTELE